MLAAITRAVSPNMNCCELSHVAREPIDIQKAIEQHKQYEDCLRDLGATVLSLAGEPDLPDSMFVEDTAVVVDEIAVMTRMGAESRRKEPESLAAVLARFRPLRWLRAPATLEGGDVLQIGSTVFVGWSRRTNREGIVQLEAELKPLGYSVHLVPVRDCLHLKSACSSLGDDTILANPEWVDTSLLHDFHIIDVPCSEPRAANVLAIGGTIVVPAAFPATADLLESSGRKVRVLDVSELMKAEAGLTCSSILFHIEERQGIR